MRICDVESWSRTSVVPSFVQRCAVRIAKTTVATSTTNPPMSSSFLTGEEDSREKNSDRSSTVPKSEIDAAPMTSCPNSDPLSPACVRIGATRPSAVDDKLMATSSADSTMPMVCRTSEIAYATTTDTPNPSRATRRRRPLSTVRSSSSPARKRRNAKPMIDSTLMRSSTTTHPRPAGPMAMPSRISSTMAGRRSRGANPSTRGATKAAVHTMTRPANGFMRVAPRRTETEAWPTRRWRSRDTTSCRRRRRD